MAKKLIGGLKFLKGMDKMKYFPMNFHINYFLASDRI